MFYYHVWVRSALYRGSDPLTYRSSSRLERGTLIEVSLRQQTVLGIVFNEVKRPQFVTKPVTTIIDAPPLPPSLLSLMAWVKQFYLAPIGVVTQQFLPLALPKHQSVVPVESTLRPTNPLPLPPLTHEQQLALQHMQQINTYLLHGRTGSGKTRVYIELAKKTLDANRSVLVLSPEIGLTSQLAARFRSVFGDSVFVLHSQLSPKERRFVWSRILRSTSPIVVIGPRSALFSPVSRLGLIVVDEAHDSAYKQGSSPYYHAVRVASSLSSISKSTLVLGSATPSITDYYVAIQKQKPIIRLDSLALPNRQKYTLTVVDLKDREQFTRTPHLSLSLLEAMAHSLQKGEQVLLYLNRRGTARVTLCQKCGWQARCPHCDLPLTYHGDSHSLRCHVCNYSEKLRTDCPRCGNPSIMFHTFGTKALVEEVQHVFSEARILRFDTDNSKAERLENQYERIIDGQVDIMIGTQIMAKGHDLPKLSTLGVVTADSSLFLPDFTAEERTYQLLTQVLGRIGRGHVDSRAVVQTYHPESPPIQSALASDWNRFYTQEIKERQKYLFPPFCHLLKLTCKRASTASAEKAALKLKQQFETLGLNIRINGPAPAFHEKTYGKYQWQLVVKATERSQLLAALTHLPSSNWSYDLDPIDLL